MSLKQIQKGALKLCLFFPPPLNFCCCWNQSEYQQFSVIIHIIWMLNLLRHSCDDDFHVFIWSKSLCSYFKHNTIWANVQSQKNFIAFIKITWVHLLQVLKWDAPLNRQSTASTAQNCSLPFVMKDNSPIYREMENATEGSRETAEIPEKFSFLYVSLFLQSANNHPISACTSPVSGLPALYFSPIQRWDSENTGNAFLQKHIHFIWWLHQLLD